jgi:hypothetical protein
MSTFEKLNDSMRAEAMDKKNGFPCEINFVLKQKGKLGETIDMIISHEGKIIMEKTCFKLDEDEGSSAIRSFIMFCAEGRSVQIDKSICIDPPNIFSPPTRSSKGDRF